MQLYTFTIARQCSICITALPHSGVLYKWAVKTELGVIKGDWVSASIGRIDVKVGVTLV